MINRHSINHLTSQQAFGGEASLSIVIINLQQVNNYIMIVIIFIITNVSVTLLALYPQEND